MITTNLADKNYYLLILIFLYTKFQFFIFFC